MMFESVRVPGFCFGESESSRLHDCADTAEKDKMIFRARANCVWELKLKPGHCPGFGAESSIVFYPCTYQETHTRLVVQTLKNVNDGSKRTRNVLRQMYPQDQSR